MKKSKISLWSIIVFIKKQPLVIICLILSIILAFIPYITANILNYVFVLINKRIYNILILFIFLYVFTRYIDSSMGVLKNYLLDKNNRMDNGEAIETGSHSDLINKEDGRYKELYALQAELYK